MASERVPDAGDPGPALDDGALGTIALEVRRFHPADGRPPRWERYEVPRRRDWTLLDALNHVKDDQDGTLTFRYSCRMGVCGSCGMTVDGEPRLACAVSLTGLGPGPVRVAPLDNFPVIRDLVSDIGDFLAKLPRVLPWIVRETEEGQAAGAGGEAATHRQTPDERDAYEAYSRCINCMLCYAACPVYALEPDFIGPAALALAQRYNLDSRDQGRQRRLAVLSNDEGVWACTLVGECSVVCPKGVDPAGAIQRYKAEAALRWWRALLPRGSKPPGGAR